MKLTLYLKQLKRHTFPKALTKAPSRSKEHAAHVVMTKVDVADTLIPALKPEPEAAVKDCTDVRDIALNSFKLSHHHGPSVQKTDGSHSGVRGLLRLWKGDIGLPVGPVDYCCLSRIVRVYD